LISKPTWQITHIYLLPIRIYSTLIQECLGVPEPGLHLDDGGGAVLLVAGVALHVEGQPVQGGAICYQGEGVGGEVPVARDNGLDELREGDGGVIVVILM